MDTQSHESLTSFRKPAQSSERKFGLTLGLILVIVGVWPIVRHHQPVRLWMLALGIILLVLGLAAPDLLAPLNRAWFRLGLLLARITNPIVMGVLFVVAIIPFGLIMRMRGRDPLRLKRAPDATTYWIERDVAAVSSLSKQF